MKKPIFLIAILLLTFTSCIKKNYYVKVEMKEVHFNTKDFLKVRESHPFARQAENFKPVIPSSYTAYFVSKEDRGQYKVGDVVDSVEVSVGDNDITIPALNYTVYVTNYKKNDKWYTWPDSTDQLPQGSDSLYLFGSNDIDYSEVSTGTVQLENNYSAIAILKNNWVSQTPKDYNSNKDFSEGEDWYYLYVRGDKTNVEVWLWTGLDQNSKINYTLNESIQPNKVYQFEFNGSISNSEGTLTIVPINFEDVVDQNINYN